MHGPTVTAFKRWFWRPPRAHGDTILDRRVSPLELLYDLVYVALIAQAAHDLSDDPTPRTLAVFTVVFAMIWFAWVNGSLYLELHGREDGRTRSFTFVQIWILALLAVFTARAADTAGFPFAVVYAAFLGVMAWLWHTVRLQDRPEFLAVTGRYLAGMILSMAAILASAPLPDGPRLLVWAGFGLAWIVGLLLLSRAELGFGRGITPTDSLVERFGTFVIVVLGEVVVGVVDGLSGAPHEPVPIATGVLALGLGFGLWWVYFDIVGGRLPRGDGTALFGWILSHLPITLAIAAAGAAMVGLIRHATDPVIPAEVAWLIAGAVALVLIAEIVTAMALADASRLASVYGPWIGASVAGAIAALAVAAIRPAPWVLLLLLGAILSTLWFFAAGQFLRIGAWGVDSPAVAPADEPPPVIAR